LEASRSLLQGISESLWEPSWEPLGAFGGPPLEAFWSVWEPSSGSLWEPLGAFGSFWELVATFLWEPLVASFWEPLGAFLCEPRGVVWEPRGAFLQEPPEGFL